MELVFSTYVEVILKGRYILIHFPWFSPRMWRWSSPLRQSFNLQLVFSTYVEVILLTSGQRKIQTCFLHVCGGDPKWIIWYLIANQFSPRMWRWSWNWWRLNRWRGVFSTYVEVILSYRKGANVPSRFLHVCGGDPASYSNYSKNIWFSPRMWRWSCNIVAIKSRNIVFSTYVEVILWNVSMS